MRRLMKISIIFLMAVSGAFASTQNSVIFSLGGEGFLASIQYERRVAPHLGMRGGVSLIPFEGPHVGIPLSFSGMWGNKKITAELGAGVIFAPDTAEEDNFIFTIIGGVRIKPIRKVFIRITVTPLLFLNDDPLIWGGIGIGYEF